MVVYDTQPTQLVFFALVLTMTKVSIIMNKVIGLFVLFSTIVTTSCEETVSAPAGNVTIISGQSFGFCVGPCYQTMTLNNANQKVNFYVKSTDSKGNQGNAMEKNYSDSLAVKEWEEVWKAVGNIDDFFSLKETYGCPDCADGGAEFIEIIRGDFSHKVTFEYGSEVKEIEDLVKLLRAQRTAFSEKYVSYV